MNKLAVSDLLSLERYARERAAFRSKVLEHKRPRQLAVGPHTTWLFEDRLTVQYQVQEMLEDSSSSMPSGSKIRSFPTVRTGRRRSSSSFPTRASGGASWPS